MSSFHETYIEKVGAEAPAKTEASIKQGYRPKLILGYSKVDSLSKPFVEKLDKVLLSFGKTFERMEIVALDAMKDRQVAAKFSVPMPGLVIMKDGKIIASMDGKNKQENDIRTFLNDNRKFLTV